MQRYSRPSPDILIGEIINNKKDYQGPFEIKYKVYELCLQTFPLLLHFLCNIGAIT